MGGGKRSSVRLQVGIRQICTMEVEIVLHIRAISTFFVHGVTDLCKIISIIVFTRCLINSTRLLIVFPTIGIIAIRRR